MGRTDSIITKPQLPPKPQLTEEGLQIANSRLKSSRALDVNSDHSAQLCPNPPVQTKPVPKPRLRKPQPKADILTHPVTNPSQTSLSGNTVSVCSYSKSGSVLPACTVSCPCQHGSRCELRLDTQGRDCNPVHISREDSKNHSAKEITVHKMTKRDHKEITVHKMTKRDHKEITVHKITKRDHKEITVHKMTKRDHKEITVHKITKRDHKEITVHKITQHENPRRVPPNVPLPPTPLSRTLQQTSISNVHMDADTSSENDTCSLTPGESQHLDLTSLSTAQLKPHPTKPVPALRKRDKEQLTTQNKTQTSADKTQIIPAKEAERETMYQDMSVPVETQPLIEHTSETATYFGYSTAAVLPSTGLEIHGTVNYTHRDSKLNNNFQKWHLESLWQERCVVRDKGILSQLTKEELLLQESMYEVVTSEQMYLDGLTVAVDHFQKSQELNSALTSIQHKLLFSDMHKIREISQNFMITLVQKLGSSLFCDTICDVVYQYASGPFNAYVRYIRNMPYQKQALINLRKESPRVVEVLNKLEENPCCNRLPLESFLSLPFQRIPRLKILMEMVLKRTCSGSKLQASAKRAVREVSKVVEECNREVGIMKQMEELVNIANKTDFQCKSLPLVSSSRWLVKEGDMVQLSLNENILGQKRNSPVHLFLFSDLLLVTTRKGSDRYMVQDHVHRSLIDVSEGTRLEEDLDGWDVNRVFRLALVKNHRGATSHFLLQAPTQAERDAWLEALTHTEEGVYEEWDCPQVQCIQAFNGKQPGELSLEREDIVNVFHKTPDGYMEGRRLYDRQSGRFPAACVREISSEHVQRRHLRERYRVLQTATHVLKRHIRQDCRTTSCFS